MATTTDNAGRMDEPAHPGEVLRALYLKPLGITITRAAEALSVSRKHVSAIVHGKAPVTLDMAMRLAAALDTEPEFWLNLQGQHDLWQARNRPRPRVKPIVGEVA